MKKLPETLSRRAIIEAFNKLAPVTWEKLFEREDSNGIGKHRIPIGPKDYKAKAYYRTIGIMGWLIREGHYRLDECQSNPRIYGEAPAYPVPRRIALSA